MADTTFVDGSTLTAAEWFNDVNRLHYTILGDPAAAVNAMATLAASWPCFLARNSTTDTNQTGAGTTVTVDFDTETYDIGSAFASDTFTAPTTGKYHFDVQVAVSSASTAMNVFRINLVTSNRTFIHIVNHNIEVSGDLIYETFSCDADMDAADTVSVTFAISGGAGDTAGIVGGANPETFFSGHQFA